jgi:hypothetical protein
MQFQGSASLGGTPMYVTGASATITRQPIIPDIVWGAGWKVSYATGQLMPTFSMSFPATSAAYNSAAGKGFSGTGRNTFFSASIDNGGSAIAFGDAKCESFQVSADALGNGPVSCTFNGVSKTATLTGGGSGGGGSNPIIIPAYSVSFSGPGATSDKVVRFDITANHNPFKLFTLNGQFIATDIQLGLMVVTGSYTFYSAGSSTEILTGGVSASGGIAFNCLQIVVTGDSSDITNPNEKPFRVISFEALGDGPGNSPIT